MTLPHLSRYLILSCTLMATCALTACGSDSSDGNPAPTAPTPSDTNDPPGNNPNTPPADNGNQDTDSPPPADNGNQDTDSTPPANGEAPTFVELLQNLLAPRDLIFGPAGTDFADEFFVVNFASAEAVWVVDFEQPTQNVGTVQSSLVGAIAVDADSDGRFYFACLIPVMGSNVGVVTVRTIDESVPDFQYKGLMTPTGVALDGQGGLFVANRDLGTVVRVRFDDGQDRDNHAVEPIAQQLSFGAEDLPNHMLVDPAGRLFICETAGDRVRVWSDEDGLQFFAGSELGLDRPVGIARRANGNLLVTNHGSGHIVELTSEGQFVNLIDTELGPDALYGITVRGDGRVYFIGGRSIYRMEE